MSKKLADRLAPGERLPATMALVAVVLLAAFMGADNGGYFVGDWTPPALLLAALVLPVAAVGFHGGTRSRLGAPALGLFALYAAWTFASILWSPNKGDAWQGAGQTLFYVLVFWAALAFTSLGASRRWVLAATVLGPAVVAAVTLPTLGARAEDLFENGRLVGSVGYYNGQAAFLLVSFWVAIHLGSARMVNPLMRAAVLAGAVLSLELAVLTQSRGAMVALAFSLPVFFLFSGQRLRGLLALVPVAAALYAAFPALNGVYVALSGGGDARTALDGVVPLVWASVGGVALYGLAWGVLDRLWEPPRALSLAVGAAALVGVGLVGALGSVVFVERYGDPTELARERWEGFKENDTSGGEDSRFLSASGSGRFALWQIAYKDFSENRLLGVGTHNYEATYYQLREKDSGFVRQPHSLPLEVLAERGVVGGALFGGCLVLCLASGLWRRFRDLGAEGKAQVGALVACVSYWFVQASAEWFWQLPAVTLPAVVFLSLLVAPWSGRGATRRAAGGVGGALLRVGGVGLALAALATTVPLLAADLQLERSRSAATPREALAAVEAAQRFNPVDPALAGREAEVSASIGDWRRAEEAYDRAIALNPEHYHPIMNLGAYHERRGQTGEALIQYEKAQELSPVGWALKKNIERVQPDPSPDPSP